MRPAARRILEVAADGTVHFFRNHGLVYSASVAFNLLLAAIPILFFVFAASAMLIGRNELPFRTLAAILRDTFPYGARVLVPNLRALIESGTTFGVIGSFLLLFTSYSATDAVHVSLAVMLGVREKRQYWRSAVFHIALVLVLIVLTSAAILVPTLWAGLAYLTKGISAGWDEAFHALLTGIGEAALAGVIFLSGYLSYRYLAPMRVRVGNALIGSAAFLVLFYAIKGGFRFYVKSFSRLNLIYGSLFSIICFIIVAYLFAAAYLFCASIIGTLEKKEGKEVFPEREPGAGPDEPTGSH
ncbi:MAG TPA: YihY/virulence factor BrkB family protein [Candidatus Deferrimicrobiaceae bacterium]